MKTFTIPVFCILLMGIFLCEGCKKKNDSSPTSPVTVRDIDGNIYTTVTIGSQTWMAENLKVTRYRNGDQIPDVMNDAQWATLTSGAICGYDNDYLTNGVTYGVLYNWFAVTDSRKLAPAGWHIPSQAEWETLITALGGKDLAGGKMKTTGTSLWETPNEGATNSSGFSSVPGGYRDFQVSFQDMEDLCGYWSTSTYGANEGCYIYINYISAGCQTLLENIRTGYSVRCIKD